MSPATLRECTFLPPKALVFSFYSWSLSIFKVTCDKAAQVAVVVIRPNSALKVLVSKGNAINIKMT